MPLRLDDQRAGSHDGDPWLPVVLGLISVARGLDRLLASPTGESTTPATGEIEASRASGKNDDALAILLGVVALEARLRAALENVATASPPRPAAEPAHFPSESLLR